MAETSPCQRNEHFLDILTCHSCSSSMFEPSKVKYFSSSKITQHDDLYNKLESFLLKFFAFFACFSVYLGVFSRLWQDMFILESCLQIVIGETPNLRPSCRWLTPLRLLVNLFSLFFLVDVQEVGRPVFFLSSIDSSFCKRFMVL